MLGVVFSERRRRLQVYWKTIRCLWTVFVNKSNKSQIPRKKLEFRSWLIYCYNFTILPLKKLPLLIFLN